MIQYYVDICIARSTNMASVGLPFLATFHWHRSLEVAHRGNSPLGLGFEPWQLQKGNFPTRKFSTSWDAKCLFSQSLWHLWRVDPPPGTLAGSLVHSEDGVAKGGGMFHTATATTPNHPNLIPTARPSRYTGCLPTSINRCRKSRFFNTTRRKRPSEETQIGMIPRTWLLA